jgi:hypothetical protein
MSNTHQTLILFYLPLANAFAKRGFFLKKKGAK